MLILNGKCLRWSFGLEKTGLPKKNCLTGVYEMDLPIKEHLKKVIRFKNSAEKRLKYLRLDKNEAAPLFSKEFVNALREEITPDFLTAYPEVAGLQEKIAESLKCNSDNIYVTAGSDAGIKSAFEVFVEKGDRVVLLDPTYAMFYVYADIFEAELQKVSYTCDLSLSAESVIATIKEFKPKLVCIANPNSPTGTVLPSEGIKKIAQCSFENKSVLLIDEAYYPFYPVTALGLIKEFPNIIVTRTFSKAMALASARLGYVAGGDEIIEALHKVRPMYETNAFAVKFAELILDNPEVLEKNLQEVKAAKKYVETELTEMGVSYFESHANFMLLDVGSYEKSVEIGKAMKERKILIKAGFTDENLKNCIRISVGTCDDMRRFIDNFKQVIISTQCNYKS
ncbi:MAG: histidinol-phosphate transaminase [Candidatus Omnitrophota bacterium]